MDNTNTQGVSHARDNKTYVYLWTYRQFQVEVCYSCCAARCLSNQSCLMSSFSVWTCLCSRSKQNGTLWTSYSSIMDLSQCVSRILCKIRTLQVRIFCILGKSVVAIIQVTFKLICIWQCGPPYAICFLFQNVLVNLPTLILIDWWFW